jgi:hypothetical protein
MGGLWRSSNSEHAVLILDSMNELKYLFRPRMQKYMKSFLFSSDKGRPGSILLKLGRDENFVPFGHSSKFKTQPIGWRRVLGACLPYEGGANELGLLLTFVCSGKSKGRSHGQNLMGDVDTQ